MSADSDDVDRKAVEDMFDATFGSLLTCAAAMGFDVEFGADGLWHAVRRELSSSAAGGASARKTDVRPTTR